LASPHLEKILYMPFLLFEPSREEKCGWTFS
jgi:hypothetical protein